LPKGTIKALFNNFLYKPRKRNQILFLSCTTANIIEHYYLRMHALLVLLTAFVVHSRSGAVFVPAQQGSAGSFTIIPSKPQVGISSAWQASAGNPTIHWSNPQVGSGSGLRWSVQSSMTSNVVPRGSFGAHGGTVVHREHKYTVLTSRALPAPSYGQNYGNGVQEKEILLRLLGSNSRSAQTTGTGGYYSGIPQFPNLRVGADKIHIYTAGGTPNQNNPGNQVNGMLGQSGAGLQNPNNLGNQAGGIIVQERAGWFP
ncbi:hypothetical protein ANCCAN_00874, partial [Ancylostoma caninum]